MSPRGITRGLWRLFRRDRAEQDLTDEVEQYIEDATRAYMREGLSHDEALRRARLDFGGVESAKEAVRESHWDGAIDGLRRDVAYAVRGLRRNPAFTLVAVLTLALGIGANTAMFSVVNAVMLRPLPYRDADRLALIWTDDVRRGFHQEALAYRTIQDFRAEQQSFTDIGFFNAHRNNVSTNGQTRIRTRQGSVSANLFSILGAPPLYGRTIAATDEESAARVVVISYSFWQREYGGDPTAIGRSILPSGDPKDDTAPLRIIGIMPAGFYFPDRNTELWTPVTTYWRFKRESIERFPSDARRWTALGRLKSGVSIERASADFANIGRRLTAAYPSTVPDFPGFTTNVVPILDGFAGRGLQSTLWILLGAVGLVLLVACANVANLLLARGAARQREFAIRLAIGAGRGRLVRQLIAESLVLAMIGGVLGLMLTFAATRILGSVAASQLPRVEELTVDGRVLLFALAASLAAGLGFGVLPAIRVSGGDASTTLKEGARGSTSGGLHRTRGLLVVAECSLAIVLLAGAGLLLRSMGRLNAIDPGYQPKGVLAIRIEYPAEPRPTDAEKQLGSSLDPVRAANRNARLGAMTARIAATPGVQSVGYIDDMFSSGPGNKSITIPGRVEQPTGELQQADVSPGFFATMRVPIIRGRDFTPQDVGEKIRALWHPVSNDLSLAEKELAAVAEPAIVNESFVRRFFPNEDPIGKRFCIDPTNKTYWYTIVGVARDMHRSGLERAAIPEYFGPYMPSPNGRADLMVRTDGDPLQVAAQLRQVIAAEIPGTVVVYATPADSQLRSFTAQRDLQTWLLTLFAALAVVLAAIGIYGVVHYAVSERTREMGVRVALGAAPADIMALVVRQGLVMPAIGIALGTLGALAATRLLSHLLFGIGAGDPLTFVAVLITLGSVAFLACLVPARRAVRVDPLTALRAD